MTFLALIRQQPVRFVAAVQATLALAVMFGVSLTEDQLAGVVVAISAWLAFLTREHVPPVPAPPASRRPVPTRPDPSVAERRPRETG